MNGIELAKKLKSITSSLQSLVECPVCLEPAKIPVKQCATGHIVCSKCAAKLKGCPSCQQPFTLENPIGFKKLLEALPRFCKNADAGCPEVVACDDHEHETYCGYRNVGCAYTECLDKLKANELIKHVADAHCASDTSGNEITTFVPLDCYSAHKLYRHPIEEFGKIFWLEEIYDGKKQQLNLVFKYAPVGKPMEDYFITVEFLNGNDFKCTHTLKAVAYCDEKSQVEPSVEEGTCLIIPHSLLMKFVAKTHSLEDFLSWKIDCFKRQK